jgi:hypothetical protein
LGIVPAPDVGHDDAVPDDQGLNAVAGAGRADGPLVDVVYSQAPGGGGLDTPLAS